MPRPASHNRIKHRVPDSATFPPNFSGVRLSSNLSEVESVGSASLDTDLFRQVPSLNSDAIGRRPSVSSELSARSLTRSTTSEIKEPAFSGLDRLLQIMNRDGATFPKQIRRSRSEPSLNRLEAPKISEVPISNMGFRFLRRSMTGETLSSGKSSSSSMFSSKRSGKSSKSSRSTGSFQRRQVWRRTALQRTGTTDWAQFVPENSAVVQLFVDGRKPMTCRLKIVVFVLLSAAAGANIIVLSREVGTGFGYGTRVYTALARTSSLAVPLISAACISSFILRVLNWWDWRFFSGYAKVAAGVGVMYLFIAAVLTLTLAFPVMPVIVGMLHVVLLLSFLRGCVARYCDTSQFYYTVGVSSALISMLILLLWCLNVATTNATWNDRTQESLQHALLDLYAEYDVTDHEVCEASARRNIHDSVENDACSKLELVAFLLWFAPILESAFFMLVALFSVFRKWLFSKHELYQLLIIIHILICFASCLSGAFWISVSISGVSKEMSLAILALMALSCLGVLVWCYFAIAMDDVLLLARGNPFVDMLSPLVGSDEFKGAVFSVAVFVVLPFLALEVFVRICQRMLGMPGPHPYFTPLALRMLRAVDNWNWSTVLEQAFWWDLFFVLVWVCGSQFGIVFMAWLSNALQDSNLVPFCFEFYFAMVTLFTLTPIPGIPVYVCCGFAFASRSRGDPELHSALVFMISFLEASLLKLSAVAVQQVIIGKLLGRSTRVQQVLGLHRSWVRAIRSLLLSEGQYVAKVLIACGGPDLPTPLLAGIFRVRWSRFSLCFLPNVGIILPCVFAGTLMADDSWSTVSRVIVAIVTVAQGILMTCACLTVLRHMALEATESDVNRVPSLESLLNRVQQSAVQQKLSRLCSEWDALPLSYKFMLTFATLVETSSAWLLFFLSSECFREFLISSEFHAAVHEGGLSGDPLNVVRPFGSTVLSLAAIGMIIMFIYYIMMHCRMRVISRVALGLQHRTFPSNSPPLSESDDSAFTFSDSDPVDEEPMMIRSLVFRGTPHFVHHEELT